MLSIIEPIGCFSFIGSVRPFMIAPTALSRRPLCPIVQVRSLSLDQWNNDWVTNMEKWGNAKATAYWEARPPPRRPTLEDSTAQNHIHKNFIRDGNFPGFYSISELSSSYHILFLTIII